MKHYGSLIIQSTTPVFLGLLFMTCIPCFAQWRTSDEWIVSDANSLSVDTKSETFAWIDGMPGLGIWVFSSHIHILDSSRDVGSARLAFADEEDKPIIIVSVERHRSGISLACVDVGIKEMKRIMTSGWIPGDDSSYELTVRRIGNSLHVILTGNNGLTYEETTPEIDQSVFAAIAEIGVGSYASKVNFYNIEYESLAKMPPAISGHYASLARSAMDDLNKNFWRGDPKTGNILPTYNGYFAAKLPLPRGGLWERGMMIFCMDTLYHATNDPIIRSQLSSEWSRIKRIYTIKELEQPGNNTPHPACDDTGWDARLYMVFYHDLGDRYALQRAKSLVNNAFNRWLDDEFGGGMWYNDAHDAKSLYQVGIVLDAFEIWEATHDQNFYDRAKSCYDWMESHLLREDGLYWCDYNADGPIGKDRPDDIREAGSVTFLGGNMGMAAVHAFLYRTTGDDEYLKRAQRTVQAISTKLIKEGIYLNDRDAWANGTFACEWARDVLTLPGIDIKHKDIFFETADSIYKYDRTPNGYYGGCWNGPADGPRSRWSMIGSRPQQIMTSASSANMIMGAALLEKLLQ